MRGSLALIVIALLIASACGSESANGTNPDTAPSLQDHRLPQPDTAGDGLALRIAGTVEGNLLCPGGRRPCLRFTGSVDLGEGMTVWVAGRLHDGSFEVDDQRSPPEQAQRQYVNQCPDQDMSGSPSNEVLEGLYEDETTRPAGFVDLWDSEDGVLHMGIFGDPTSAEIFLDDLGIADQVCLVVGFPHSDATLESVQFALNDLAAEYGFDNYSSSHDNWEGTVTFSVPRFDHEFRAVVDELSAANSDVPITIEANVEVVSGSLADYDDLLTQVEVSPDPAQQLQARCGQVLFSGVPPDLNEFPALDADAQSAIDELVNGPTGVEAEGFGDDTRWSMAARTDDELVLFGRQQLGAEVATVSAQFTMRSGAWMPTGWGGCRVQIEAPGLGPATVSTNPSALPRPVDTELALFITEQSCASGQAPIDREVVVVVTETADEVHVIALVAPVEGDADCPGNPLHPITVSLDAPLGERTLVDGHRFPALVVVPAEDFDN